MGKCKLQCSLKVVPLFVVIFNQKQVQNLLACKMSKTILLVERMCTCTSPALQRQHEAVADDDKEQDQIHILDSHADTE